VSFSALEEVQQQVADAEEEAAACKLHSDSAAEAAAEAVVLRDLRLERAASGKALVDVLMESISELEKLHCLQATVCHCTTAGECQH
jgi:hypothetical protein